MTSDPAGLVGAQSPRVCWVPPSVSSAGQEAVELCEAAGLHLDPWEKLVLASSLGERPDGLWSAFEVGLVVARQNGKGAILEGRELAGLYLLDERFITHSAHQFDTSLEAFRRLLSLIEDNDEFSRRIKRVMRGHGEEGIELTSGQRIRFRTRTKGGGRGFSGDLLVLDEAMDLPLSAHGALLPTLSARPNPQIWYTGSAVDQNVQEHGLVLARIRHRGLQGNDERLMYMEWSPDVDLDKAHEVLDSREAWAAANPGLGIRITPEFVEMERRSMDPRTFAVERLTIGDWPSLEEIDQDDISLEEWSRCEDEDSHVVGPVRFAVDVTPDRKHAAVCVAGVREDGLRHVEVVEHKSGTRWIPARAAELIERYQAGPLILDDGGPAAALKKPLDEAGVEVETVNGREYSQACGLFFDEVKQANVRHIGQHELAGAVRGAGKRPLGDAWAWSRKSSAVDISPLVAATLALSAVAGDRPSVYEDDDVVLVV